MLTDLGSTNGTFVEGERLTGETALTPGTTLRFGDVFALFEPLDEPTPRSRSAAGAQSRVNRPAPGRAGTAEARPRTRPRRPIRAVDAQAERAAAVADRADRGRGDGHRLSC